VAGIALKFCEQYNDRDLLALADEDGILTLYNSNIHGRKALLKGRLPCYLPCSCITCLAVL